MLNRLFDPFQSLLDLQRTLDDMASDDWFRLGTSSRGGFPAVNVFDNNGDYVVVAELPGVKKEDLAVEVRNSELRLSGRRAQLYGDDVSVHRKERRTGTFDRVIGFPVDIDSSKVKAELRDGMLALFVPRPESHKPRTIHVE